MSQVPVFVEVLSRPEHAGLEICRKIVAQLLKRAYPPPLPFISSSEDFKQVISSLAFKKVFPSIFVVNPLWADDILPLVNERAGQSPVLLMRRMIEKPCAALPGCRTVEIPYGTATSDEIAAALAPMLMAYMSDGDLSKLEDFSRAQEMENFRKANGESSRRRWGSGPIRIPD